MQRKRSNLGEKVGNGIKTLIRLEKRLLSELVCDKPINNYIALHFGNGAERDYITLTEFVLSLKFDKSQFRVSLFIGYPYALLTFAETQNAIRFGERLRDFTKESSDLKTEFGLSLKDFMRLSPLLAFGDALRNCVFLPTKLSDEHFLSSKSQENSLSIASRNAGVLASNGLFMFENAVAFDEERELVALIESGKWEKFARQKAQFYGYRFFDDFNSIDKSTKIGIPSILLCPLKNAKFGLSHDFDQITINEYKIGARISAQSDAHSLFDETIVILSLLSDIVIDFGDPITGETHNLVVPSRSALVLKGAARYAWTRSISQRRVDRVGDETLFRRRRIAIIYRKTRATPFCDCRYASQCDFQRSKCEVSEGAAFERKFVREVYNKIGRHFSETRHSEWPRVAAFIANLAPNAIVADVGCGNGKYMRRNAPFIIGSDAAETFGAVVRAAISNAQFLLADNLALPYASDTFDAVLSIAVVHHFSSAARRARAISELFRITRRGGLALIYVWAFEQERTFASQDVFIEWNNPKKYESGREAETPRREDAVKGTTVYNRYYHMFKKGELESLVDEVGEGKVFVDESLYDHQNWVVIARKS